VKVATERNCSHLSGGPRYEANRQSPLEIDSEKLVVELATPGSVADDGTKARYEQNFLRVCSIASLLHIRNMNPVLLWSDMSEPSFGCLFAIARVRWPVVLQILAAGWQSVAVTSVGMFRPSGPETPVSGLAFFAGSIASATARRVWMLPVSGISKFNTNKVGRRTERGA
jgi:hypothetical protein